MDQGPDFLTRDTTEDVIIRTTLDQRLQRAAEEALAFRSSHQGARRVEGAGRDRGDVGRRRGARHGGRARSAPRGRLQPRHAGQAADRIGFKPFVYAAALDLGYSPSMSTTAR
jgi:penicillin-binding protein 1A